VNTSEERIVKQQKKERLIAINHAHNLQLQQHQGSY